MDSQAADRKTGGKPAAAEPVEPFAQRLAREGLTLARGRTRTLQVNVGPLCNQACRHCHLEAGPDRPEAMGRETAEQVLAFAGRHRFECIDITGGAPEMSPHLAFLLAGAAAFSPRLMLRSNLTALARADADALLGLCRDCRVVLVASLPSTHAGQTDAQRGKGALAASLRMLEKLNLLGYGRPDTGLELNLVSNPAGAFLPAAQCQAEQKFRLDLERKWDIVFNRLYTFANVPLGRFRKWLQDSGNFGPYMERLAGSFNPSTLEGLMCRSQVSVSWDGHLYDCDFNLAAGLPLGPGRQHVREALGPPPAGAPIATGDYCYACTAGAGFT